MIRIIVQDQIEERAIRSLLDSDTARAFRGRYDFRIELDEGESSDGT